MGLLEDIISGLRSFFDTYVVSPIKTAAGKIDEIKNTVWNTITSKVNEVIGRLSAFGNEVKSFVSSKIAEANNWINTNVVPKIIEFKNYATSKFMETGTAIHNFANYVYSRLPNLPHEIWARVSPYITPLLPDINFLKGLIPTKLTNLPHEVYAKLLPNLTNIQLQLPKINFDIKGWLEPALGRTVEEIGKRMKTMLDGAFGGLADFLGVLKMFNVREMMESWGTQAQTVLNQAIGLIASAGAHSSPVSPEDAAGREASFTKQAAALSWVARLTPFAIEVASAGQVDFTSGPLFESPEFQVAMDAYKQVMMMKINMGFLQPLRYFYNRVYQPNIPPVNDLITMVVREAFDPKRVTPAPELFAKYMELQGFSKEWADRYWTAHWVLIPLERVTEMYWRGIVTEDFYKYYLVLHDYRPDEIPYILKWVWRPPNRVEARMMYDLGVLKEEDLDYIAKSSGIEERFREGWKEMIRGFRVRPILTLIESFAREQYEDGYMNNAEYLKLLKESGLSPRVIDMEFKFSQLKRRFALIREQVKIVLLKYQKDQIDRNEAMRQLNALGLDTETAVTKLNEIEVKKLKVPREVKERVPKLTVAQLVSAWKADVITTEQLVDTLTAKGYTEQEAMILIETELRKGR